MSEFRTVAESVSAVRERVDRIEPKLDKQGEDIEILKAAARSQTNAIASNTEATRANTEAIHAMQADLKNINGRLEMVETKLAS